MEIRYLLNYNYKKWIVATVIQLFMTIEDNRGGKFLCGNTDLSLTITKNCGAHITKYSGMSWKKN